MHTPARGFRNVKSPSHNNVDNDGDFVKSTSVIPGTDTTKAIPYQTRHSHSHILATSHNPVASNN